MELLEVEVVEVEEVVENSLTHMVPVEVEVEGKDQRIVHDEVNEEELPPVFLEEREQQLL